MTSLYAMAPDGGANLDFLSSMFPFLLIIGIFYFLIIRPQQKKQKERDKMLGMLKKGDSVVTIGGIHGKVVGFKSDDKIVVIKVDDKMNLTVDRSSISNIKGMEGEKLGESA